MQATKRGRDESEQREIRFRFCRHGKTLLQIFADAQPLDYFFLGPADFIHPEGEAFSGIKSWDILARHLRECPQCRPY
jgi:hypothetical protein